MNIKSLNLRNTKYQEIYDSFAGILRISPYKSSAGVIYDDVSPFLKTEGNEILLSDSAGNMLPVTFISKLYSTSINLDGKVFDNLVYISHLYDSLNVYSELHIRPTLYIDLTVENSSESLYPIKFVDSLGRELYYPYEAPYDANYLNANNALSIGAINPTDDDDRIDAFFDKTVTEAKDLYTDSRKNSSYIY